MREPRTVNPSLNWPRLLLVAAAMLIATTAASAQDRMALDSVEHVRAALEKPASRLTLVDRQPDFSVHIEKKRPMQDIFEIPPWQLRPVLWVGFIRRDRADRRCPGHASAGLAICFPDECPRVQVGDQQEVRGFYLLGEQPMIVCDQDADGLRSGGGSFHLSAEGVQPKCALLVSACEGA